ncbi:MAG: glutamyl-tRNA amidotransferase [Oscillospiraceae bacterium]
MTNKTHKSLKGSMTAKGLMYFRTYISLVFILALLMTAALPVFATTGGATDPLAAVNNFTEFIFGIVRAVGIVITGFGILQVGMSISSHDATQRSTGFLSIAGGILIIFTKEILNIITGV